MDIKSFVERAKGAAAAVADKAMEVAANAAEQAMPVAPAASGEPSEEQAPAAEGGAAPVTASPAAPNHGKRLAALTAEKFTELKALGSEKIQDLISSFQQSLPAIKMAGYELTEFEIELGVTPKLIPHFRHAEKSLEDVERAREAVRDNKFGSLMLGALLKAGEVHKQIKVAGFGFSHVEIELGVIPSVRLQYKNDAETGAPSAELPRIAHSGASPPIGP